MRLPVLAVLAAGLCVPLARASESNAPIAVEITSHLGAERGWSRTLGAALEGDTESTARDVQNALTGTRWMQFTRTSPEVRVVVYRRSREETSRSTDKKGRITIHHRYTAAAAVEIGEDVTQVSADHNYSHSSAVYRDDATQFRNVAGELAGKVRAAIAAQLDELRPDRPRAGFTHKTKFKFLIKGDGLEVTEVEPGGPAEAAGLRVKDRIRRINEEKGTGEMDAIVQGWWTEAPGTRFTLEIERDKRRQPVDLVLAAPRGADSARAATPEPRPRASAAPEPKARASSASGVELKPGMTEREVVRALGAPAKKVAFGAKSIWTYDGFTVTLVNGKVTDVN